MSKQAIRSLQRRLKRKQICKNAFTIVFYDIFQEFLCYRIFYLILANHKYEINRLLIELTDDDLAQKDVQIAFKLKNAMDNGNVARVFAIYKTAPYLSQYLMDLFINKLRIWSLSLICKGYGERISIQYLKDLLAFNDELHCECFIEETSIF